jgi:hypothetical protein
MASPRLRHYGERTAVNAFLVIGAFGLALLTAAWAAVAVRRARAAADACVVEAIGALADGMQELVRDLAVAIEKGQTADR